MTEQNPEELEDLLNEVIKAPDHYGELEPGNYFTISLTDTGSGISKENIEEVFEPFFSPRGQADQD